MPFMKPLAGTSKNTHFGDLATRGGCKRLATSRRKRGSLGQMQIARSTYNPQTVIGGVAMRFVLSVILLSSMAVPALTSDPPPAGERHSGHQRHTSSAE